MTPTIQVLKLYYTDKIIHPCISVCSAVVLEALFVEAKDRKYPSVQEQMVRPYNGILYSW